MYLCSPQKTRSQDFDHPKILTAGFIPKTERQTPSQESSANQLQLTVVSDEYMHMRSILFCICWLVKKALFLLRTIEHNPVTKSILINVLTSIVPLEVHFTLLFEAISTELIICIGLYLFEFHGLFPKDRFHHSESSLRHFLSLVKCT